jgi:hypothetical protein
MSVAFFVRPSIARTLTLASAVALLGAVPVWANGNDENEPPKVTITGVVELNYTLNFNQPANGSNTYLYNTKEGQFAINLADLRIGKAATPESRAGFLLRLIEGEVRQRNFIAGEANFGNTSELPHILEAYGTYLLPFGGKDLKVDVGQFVTHVGYETIDIGTNNFFSRNFLFQFPSPFYNAGIRASIPLGSKTTVTGYLYNRYNGTNDTGNRDIAPGFQIVQTFSSKSNLVFNGLTSRENLNYTGFGPSAPGGSPFPTPNNKTQSVLDLIYTNQFGSIKFIAEGLYRFGKNSENESYTVLGGAIYGIYGFSNGNVLALRAETLSSDKVNNPALPAYPIDSESKPSLGSVTLAYELNCAKLLPNMRTIFEYRYDFAGKKFFPGKGISEGGISDFKTSQSTFTIGQVFSF